MDNWYVYSVCVIWCGMRVGRSDAPCCLCGVFQRRLLRLHYWECSVLFCYEKKLIFRIGTPTTASTNSTYGVPGPILLLLDMSKVLQNNT